MEVWGKQRYILLHSIVKYIVSKMDKEVPIVKISSEMKEAISNLTTPSKLGHASVSGTPHSGTFHKRSASRTSSGRCNVKSSNDISPASMIFRNLLILEDDLRRQAHEQKFLRWQFTTFLTCLFSIASYALYALYFTEITVTNGHFSGEILDDKSFTGIPRSILKITIIFISVTFALFNISGEYRRTIVIPRKFFTLTNKGIRQFNVKLVKVENTFNEKFTDMIRFVSRTSAQITIYILKDIFKLSDNMFIVKFWVNVKIRAQPRVGAVDVKLVLNPRAFSSEVREGWEIYRDEFWAREGARRRHNKGNKKD